MEIGPQQGREQRMTKYTENTLHSHPAHKKDQQDHNFIFFLEKQKNTEFSRQLKSLIQQTGGARHQIGTPG